MPSPLQESFFQNPPYLLASTGKQYLVNPDPAGKILLQTRTGSAWDEPVPLSQGGEKYCAALDINRCPHLVILERGNFYHLILSAEPEKDSAVLFYREESKKCSHFLIAGDRQGLLHFICLAVDPSAERWWLLHHRYTGNAWEEPRVIDFGSGTAENYGDLALDDRSCLHLVYRIANANQAGLYHRFFDPDSGLWSKAFPLSASAAVDYPSIAVDPEQNLHVLWRTVLEGKYYICYRFMGGPNWQRSGWKPETVISPALAEPPFPFVLYQSEELYIAWLESDMLSRFRFGGDQWEQIAPQRFEKPLLIRGNSFSLEEMPLNYWIPVENVRTTAGEPVSDFLLAVDDGSDLDSDFHKLRRYSGKLIGRISDLSTAKARLEEEVKARSKEMLLFSEQSEKTVQLLQNNLEQKDAELKKLQKNFEQIIETMKRKIEQGRQIREAERKRYLDELQQFKKERSQIERILQEKEKTIARLEARNREQQYFIEQLREENKALIAKAESRNIRKLCEKIILHKKP